MPSSLSRGLVSFKVDKKENQFGQANSNFGKADNSNKGITFAKATRQQELRSAFVLYQINIIGLFLETR